MPGFRQVILSVVPLNLLYELTPYETSENRVSLELYVQGLRWFCCSRDFENDSSHSGTPTHTGTFPALTTNTAWQLHRYPHDRFFSVSCSSLGSRHHLFAPSSPALILCHPAPPNTRSPSLNNCSKVADCAYASFFFEVPFMFCQQTSLKYRHRCLNAFLYAIA